MSVRCDCHQSLCFSLCLCFGLGFLLQLHVSSFHNTKDINITWQHLHHLIRESIMQCDYEYQVNSIKRFASLGHSITSLFTSISWTPKVNHVLSLLIQTLIIFWYRHFSRALHILCLCTSQNSVSHYLKPNLQPNYNLQAIRLVLVELLQIQLINKARAINVCIAYMLHQRGFLKSLSIEFKWVLLWPFFFLMICQCPVFLFELCLLNSTVNLGQKCCLHWQPEITRSTTLLTKLSICCCWAEM